MIWMKFDVHVKNIRNMKFNGYIFKIHTQYKNIREIWKVSRQISLERNFVFIVKLCSYRDLLYVVGDEWET